jgi:hypothetical protein
MFEIPLVLFVCGDIFRPIDFEDDAIVPREAILCAELISCVPSLLCDFLDATFDVSVQMRGGRGEGGGRLHFPFR